MLYILDSANVEEIRRCMEYFPIDGVTTNPTIISREKRNFLEIELKSNNPYFEASFLILEEEEQC